MHRSFKGILREVSKLGQPFFCPQCCLDKQSLEITFLMVEVSKLSSQLVAACSNLEILPGSLATFTRETGSTGTPGPTAPNPVWKTTASSDLTLTPSQLTTGQEASVFYLGPSRAKAVGVRGRNYTKHYPTSHCRSNLVIF